MQKQRLDQGFPLIQPHLNNMGLPVKELDQITCWENIQYSLLCLSDENFEYFLMTNEELKELLKDKKQQTTTQKALKTGDKYIDEIEKSFEKGNVDDVMKLLENM